MADNLRLPHPCGVFDFAISIAVIHHLSTSERRVKAISEILRRLKSSTSSYPISGKSFSQSRALIYVWALEQKNSRRGWDTSNEQDVMVPWTTRSNSLIGHCGNDHGRSQELSSADGVSDSSALNARGKQEAKTFQRYYHLYRAGELERDIAMAGGYVSQSGYEKDNWWAVAARLDAAPALSAP
ncbi:MAG: tRNA methyltransferase, has a role in tRNA modification [Caeruleum heppii]|nr:MAG: tRNA methyltransferase, has a role in tRNA modification [Caeruleum heppii]